SPSLPTIRPAGSVSPPPVSASGAGGRTRWPSSETAFTGNGEHRQTCLTDNGVQVVENVVESGAGLVGNPVAAFELHTKLVHTQPGVEQGSDEPVVRHCKGIGAQTSVRVEHVVV
ncbi:hypothetical protein, partial [Nocardia uniformis]|uniref:hypothetical protein n=1 Tax=Nocardia uniformis TaxID=53432 RepID=UPI001C3F5CA4